MKATKSKERQYMNIERTFIILKVDAVQRGIIGEIIGRFEKVGLRIAGLKMMQADEVLANRHYPKDRHEFIEGMGMKTLDNYAEQGKDPLVEFGHADAHKIGLEVQKWLVEFLVSGPVVVMVLEGPHAVELVRKLVGHTLPLKAQPGTIRGDFSFDSSALANESKRPIRNLIHASGNKEEADIEISLWFKSEELFDYQTVHQRHMMA
jgi:nucleoside-diphosphate kinase